MPDLQPWQTRLDSYPRLVLGQSPTPLEFLPRLSREISRPVYVKRDDGVSTLTFGPGLGGNKTRKLEYLLADAQMRQTRKVVTFGGLQSNHARLTAAAARRCGLEPHLFYFEPRPPALVGNLLLNQLFDARLHFIPFGGGSSNRLSIETTIRLVHLLAYALVGRHYFIPVGGHNWLGCLGYVRAAGEIAAQARALGLADARLVLAAGSGGTLAGLLAELALAESDLSLLGIDVGKLWRGFPASIARLAGELCRRLGQPRSFRPDQIPLIEASYVGPGYGKPSAAGNAALRRLARLEGLLLDPIYTAKAFAGLLDLCQRHQMGGAGPLIFLHTGGLPALFACDDVLG